MKSNAEKVGHIPSRDPGHDSRQNPGHNLDKDGIKLYYDIRWLMQISASRFLCVYAVRDALRKLPKVDRKPDACQRAQVVLGGMSDQGSAESGAGAVCGVAAGKVAEEKTRSRADVA